jgi:glycosyltransferase involved in cell wall biosynthesis
MNIAIVVPGGVDRSGTHRVVPALLWLIERLARSHRVTVFALNQTEAPARYPLLGATVICLGRAGQIKHLPTAVKAILRETRNARFDVIHGFWAAPGGLIAGVAGRMLGVPSVASLWGGEHIALPRIGYGSQLRWQSKAIVALGCRAVSCVTAPSKHRIGLAQRYGVVAEEVAIGVPANYFIDITDIALSNSPPRLLHVASLNRVKDQTMLLHAMRRICNESPDAHLDVVGEDTLNGEMQQLADTLGLSSHISFHGFKTAEETRAFFRQAHVFLLTSQSEAGPLVILEAAAHGVPTVGTRVGHVADLAPIAVVAVPVGDVDAFAQATLALLNNPHKRRTIASAAQEWARAHDADWTAQMFEAIYTRLASR